MLFHWYLFVILFVLWLFTGITDQSDSLMVAGEKEKRVRWFPALLMAAVLIYVAATRDPSVGDTSAYMLALRSSPDTLRAIPEVWENARKDKGFYVFVAILKTMIGTNYTLFFGIISCFCILVVVSVYRKYSCDFFLSIFLFLASSDYIQWTHNGMRQFIAVCMMFAGTDWLLQKQYVRYICLILVASLFHASSLVMLPVCFLVSGKPWNNRCVLFLTAVLLAAASVDSLRGIIVRIMENSQYSGEVRRFLNNDGTNVLRVLVFSVPPMMALVFRRRLLLADVPIINLATGMSIVSMGFYILSMVTSGMYVGRIPIFFSLYNYLLLPWMIRRAFEKRTALLMNLVMIGCYLYFYYYQVHVVWG